MINLTDEEVLSLADATKRLPARRSGRRPHISCLYRWAQTGVRGVKLETLRVGGTLCTSIEALQRFCEHCTDPATAVTTKPSKRRQQQIDAADRELAEAGI